MIALRVILITALIAQLLGAYPCCVLAGSCASARAEVPAREKACCTRACCAPADARGHCDMPEKSGPCPCCLEHPPAETRPVEAVAVSQDTWPTLLTSPALAPQFDQLPADALVMQPYRFQPHAPPTIRRLAQLNVWRN